MIRNKFRLIEHTRRRDLRLSDEQLELYIAAEWAAYQQTYRDWQSAHGKDFEEWYAARLEATARALEEVT